MSLLWVGCSEERMSWPVFAGEFVETVSILHELGDEGGDTLVGSGEAGGVCGGGIDE